MSGAPEMCPRWSRGVGTVSLRGRWSTRGVEKKGSVVNSRMSAVYSSSRGCWAVEGRAVAVSARMVAARVGKGGVGRRGVMERRNNFIGAFPRRVKGLDVRGRLAGQPAEPPDVGGSIPNPQPGSHGATRGIQRGTFAL